MKQKTVFVCNQCGYESGKWLGKCLSCGAWDSMEEKTIAPPVNAQARSTRSIASAAAVELSSIPLDCSKRIATGIGEFDRVLGGGIVPGSCVLIGGDPGIGKSTILLQSAAALALSHKVLYVTGEESAAQLKLRAQRLNVREGIMILAETDILAALGEAERIAPEILIIDSIQTMCLAEIASASGSMVQIREITNLLTRYAKTGGCSVFIVGHVTKDGAIAGPRILEHMVDTVLYFEGESRDAFRLLRAVKNRYGSTNEIGVFEMTDTGMSEVSDPSRLFLSDTRASGCAVSCALEGSRPILVEIQALLSQSPFNNPRRMASGMDNNRLVVLLAVLEKKAGLKLYDKDVYTNVAGGMRIAERSCDLAVALSIAGAAHDIAMPENTAALGEIGLTGELRSVSRLDMRVKECVRLGYKSIIMPEPQKPIDSCGAKITYARTVSEAIKLVYGRM